MIHLEESRLTRVVERKLASGVTNLREGTVLVHGGWDSNGQMTVNVAKGDATDVFAGFALSEITDLDNLVAIEEHTLPATTAAGNATINLDHTPQAATATVTTVGLFAGNAESSYTNATRQATEAAVNAANEWWFGGTKMVFYRAASQDALTLSIMYRYVPTVHEARRIQGDTHPGFSCDSRNREPRPSSSRVTSTSTTSTPRSRLDWQR